jgi:hypothetical protein
MRMRGRRAVITTDAQAARAADRAMRRLPRRWARAAAAAAASTGVDQHLVCAVMAVEHGERGRLFRGLEYAYAMWLWGTGQQARAERVSVGPAQVQLRHAGPGTTVPRRLALLAPPTGAARYCAAIIARECAELGLDPSRPHAWSDDEWQAIGRAYCGKLATGYGMALRSVHSGLVGGAETPDPEAVLALT